MDRAPRFDDRRAVRSAPDPAGRHRRIGHRRPALRRRGRRDRLVQPVRELVVRADQHRGVPDGRPAEHGAGARPARHRHGLPGLVLAAARRARGAAALRRPDGRQKPHLLIGVRNNLGAETRVTYAPSTRFYVADEAAGPAVGDAAAVPGPGGRAGRDDRLDRPEPARHALRLPPRLLRRRTSASSAASAWSSSGTPRSSATTQPSPTATSRTGTSSRGRRRCSPGPGSTPARSPRRGGHPAVPERVLDRAGPAGARPGGRRRRDAAAGHRAPRRPRRPSRCRRPIARSRDTPCAVEVYADDGSPAAANPYTVTEQNFTDPLPADRGPEPARGVLRPSARGADVPLRARRRRSAGQPRDRPWRSTTTATSTAASPSAIRAAPGTRRPNRHCSLPTQEMLAYDQARLHVRGTEHGYTNAIDDLASWPDAYRAPLPAATDDAEITGVAPSVKGTGITNLFTFDEVDGARRIWPRAGPEPTTCPTSRSPLRTSTGPAPRPPRPPGGSSRASGSVYRSDDLTALLPPGPAAAPGAARPVLPGRADARPPVRDLRDARDRRHARPKAATSSCPARPAGGSRPAGLLLARRQRHAAEELATRAAHFFLPRRAVDPFGAITRVDYDSGTLLPVDGDRPGRQHRGRQQRLPRAAARHGHRPQRQPGIGVAFDALGQVTATAVMGKTTEAVGRPADRLQPPTSTTPRWLAQFADPLADPAAILGERHHPDPLRPRRLPADRATAPALAARRLHAGPRDPRLRPGPGADDAVPVPLRLRRRLRPGDPAQGPGRAGARRQRHGAPALGRLRLDDLRQQGPTGPRSTSRSSPRRTPSSSPPRSGCQHGHALRPAGPRRRHAAPRQHLGEGGVRALARAAVGRQRHRPSPDPRDRPRRRRLLPAAAREPRPFTSWYDLRIGGQFGATRRAAGRRAGRRAQGGPARRDPGGRPPRLGRAGPAWRSRTTAPGGRYPTRTAYDTEGKPLAVFDALGRRAEEYCYRTPDPAAASPTSRATTWPAKPSTASTRTAARGAAWPDVAGQPIRTLGCPRPRVPARLRSGAAPDAPLREHGRRARDPARP